MSKNITEQIEDLQHENERLKELDKLFERAVKNEFGCDRKSIHKKLNNEAKSGNEFESKIADYFNLKTPAEMEEFLSVICSESTLKYFNSKRAGESV